jgi:hypothetical protein
MAPATLDAPRSPWARLGLSPRFAAPSGTPQRLAVRGSQRRCDALGRPAGVGTGQVGRRGRPGGRAGLCGHASGRPAGRRGPRGNGVAQTRAAGGWGGTPGAWDGWPDGALPQWGVAGLCQSAWPGPAGWGTLWGASVAERPRALCARWQTREAPVCPAAALGPPEAPARVRRTGAGSLGAGRERLWRCSLAARVAGGARAPPGVGCLGASRGLACRPATAGHHEARHAGPGGRAPGARWRRSARAARV